MQESQIAADQMISDNMPMPKPDGEAIAQMEPTARKSVSKRIRYMDYLNVFACIAVVMLHCSLDVFTPTPSRTWAFALIIQVTFIFATSVFFMISGANLMGYRERYSTSTFFKKRLKRILIPLVVGSIVFYIAGYYLKGVPGVPQYEFTVGDFVKRFASNNIQTIFWFFYTIFGLYIMTPILSKLADDKNTLLYAIVAGILVAFLLPFVNEYQPHAQDYFGTFAYLPMFTTALVYFLVGYYINRYVKKKVNPVILIAVFIICVAWMFFHTYNANDPMGPEFIKGFDSAGSLPAFITSCCVFIFFKDREEFFAKHDAIYNLIKKMSAATLWVYVFHMLFVYSTWPMFEHPGIVHFFIKPLIVYVVTVTVVCIVQALWKYIKKKLTKPAVVKDSKPVASHAH